MTFSHIFFFLKVENTWCKSGRKEGRLVALTIKVTGKKHHYKCTLRKGNWIFFVKHVIHLLREICHPLVLFPLLSRWNMSFCIVSSLSCWIYPSWCICLHPSFAPPGPLLSAVAWRVKATKALSLAMSSLHCPLAHTAFVFHLQACGCPLYWKAPMFRAAGGERTGFVSAQSFITMWRK